MDISEAFDSKTAINFDSELYLAPLFHKWDLTDHSRTELILVIRWIDSLRPRPGDTDWIPDVEAMWKNKDDNLVDNVDQVVQLAREHVHLG